MNTENKEPSQFDGGEPTEAEAALIALGTDELDPAAEQAALDAAAEAESVRVAAAALAAETAPVAAATVVPDAITLPEKPAAPKDFAAAVEALTQSYNDSDIDQAEFQKQMRELTLEEGRYERAVERWEENVQTIQAQQTARIEDDWTKTALAFETANKDFLANPIRHARMQEAIGLVEKQIADEGKPVTHAAMLDRALKIAVDFCGYTKPADTPESKEAVGKALADRRTEKPAQTLGDAPQAHVETVRGSETFDSLDALPIPDLEVAFANMSPSAQEKYLRDAPGATANGRE